MQTIAVRLRVFPLFRKLCSQSKFIGSSIYEMRVKRNLTNPLKSENESIYHFGNRRYLRHSGNQESFWTKFLALLGQFYIILTPLIAYWSTIHNTLLGSNIPSKSRYHQFFFSFFKTQDILIKKARPWYSHQKWEEQNLSRFAV